MYGVEKFQSEENLFWGPIGFGTWENKYMEKNFTVRQIKNAWLCVLFVAHDKGDLAPPYY
jgi:hypothetical protein